MATFDYLAGRKTWSRPQIMLWSTEAPTLDERGRLVPPGSEELADQATLSAAELLSRFLILSDHNRSPIDISFDRIEKRQRMANGAMRSLFIADKAKISVSWSMLPSRSFLLPPLFNGGDGSVNPIIRTPADITRPYGDSSETYYANESFQYTADGGAGGTEILDWYSNNTGPFWVLLSYDRYSNFPDDSLQRIRLAEYVEAKLMYISSFEYSIVKRGATKFDMWNISVTLEEA